MQIYFHADHNYGEYDDDDNVSFLLWADQRQGRGWEVVATSHSPMWASTVVIGTSTSDQKNYLADFFVYFSDFSTKNYT